MSIISLLVTLCLLAVLILGALVCYLWLRVGGGGHLDFRLDEDTEAEAKNQGII